MNLTADAKTLLRLKTNPFLDEICSRYPEEWTAVQQDLAAIVNDGNSDLFGARSHTGSVAQALLREPQKACRNLSAAAWSKSPLKNGARPCWPKMQV